MNPLLLVLPYCKKDADLLAKCLRWMADLQSDYRPHACLLAADATVPPDRTLELQAIAKPLFWHTETIVVRVPEAKQNWTEGANAMFAAASRQIKECYRLPWLWFEPDAVPLKGGWLDMMALEYQHCPKRFMGALIPSDGQPDLPPLHLAGCAVYPPDAFDAMQQFATGKRAFDIAAAPVTVPRAVNTPLIQHFWGKPGLAPTFRETKGADDPENTIPMGYLKPEAVMWHRCKDGTLIDLLAARRSGTAAPPPPEPTQTALADIEWPAAEPKRGPGRPRKFPESVPARTETVQVP